MNINHAAEALINAEKSKQPIAPISASFDGMTMSDAYEIQRLVMEAKLAAGRKVVGWKIGLTSRAMQSAFGLDTPDSGVLFDDMVFEHEATIASTQLIAPLIEAEIAFLMKAPLAADATRADVLAATEAVAPALEVLELRTAEEDAKGNKRKVLDTISDNAGCGGVVLGPQRHAPEIDLRWTGVLLSRNGEIEETGLGAAVLGDPVESVMWLARRMGAYGQSIEAGQIILSGSFIRPVACPSGSHIHADFGPFGAATLNFE